MSRAPAPSAPWASSRPAATPRAKDPRSGAPPGWDIVPPHVPEDASHSRAHPAVLLPLGLAGSHGHQHDPAVHGPGVRAGAGEARVGPQRLLPGLLDVTGA